MTTSELVAMLRAAESRAAARALLEGLSAVELEDVTDALGCSRRRLAKDRLKHLIVELAVGRRLDSAAIRGTKL